MDLSEAEMFPSMLQTKQPSLQIIKGYSYIWHLASNPAGLLACDNDDLCHFSGALEVKDVCVDLEYPNIHLTCGIL